jgi:hypothetical protein
MLPFLADNFAENVVVEKTGVYIVVKLQINVNVHVICSCVNVQGGGLLLTID